MYLLSLRPNQPTEQTQCLSLSQPPSPNPHLLTNNFSVKSQIVSNRHEGSDNKTLWSKIWDLFLTGVVRTRDPSFDSKFPPSALCSKNVGLRFLHYSTISPHILLWTKEHTVTSSKANNCSPHFASLFHPFQMKQCNTFIIKLQI